MTDEKLQHEIGKEYVTPKKGDNKPVTEDIIRALPKVELHCHLDGSLRVETVIDEAERQKVKLPTENIDELKKMLQPGFGCKSLVEYLKAFDITLSVLQDEDALYRVAYELIEDVSKENVKYIEVRYSPILHQKKGLGLVAILEAVLAGLKQGEKDFGVKSGIIICGIRNIDPKYSMKLAELSVAYKNKGVVAFDLAGAEEDYPAKEHRDAFHLVLKNNLNSTAHAGEAYGPESIHQAIHYCGAHRIGHGTRLFENGDLLNYVNDHRIPLEICISSNIQTKAVKRFEDHPVRLYYDLGLRITLNTDNRLVSDTTLTREFMIAHEHYGFTLEEIKDIIIQSFKSAFIPYRDRREMLKEVIKELENF